MIDDFLQHNANVNPRGKRTKYNVRRSNESEGVFLGLFLGDDGRMIRCDSSDLGLPVVCCLLLVLCFAFFVCLCRQVG
jgi:hypothetical protein